MGIRKKAIELIAGDRYIVLDKDDIDDTSINVRRDLRVVLQEEYYKSDIKKSDPKFDSILKDVMNQNEVEITNKIYSVSRTNKDYTNKYQLVCTFQLKGMLKDILTATKMLNNLTYLNEIQIVDTYK